MEGRKALNSGSIIARVVRALQAGRWKGVDSGRDAAYRSRFQARAPWRALQAYPILLGEVDGRRCLDTERVSVQSEGRL